MTITVTHMVKADTDTEAIHEARQLLPADHRAEAILVDVWKERWLEGRWNVQYELPSFDIADALVPDWPWEQIGQQPA